MKFPSWQSRSLLLPLVIVLALAVPFAGRSEEKKDTDLALKAAAALYDDVRVETLPNGLKVYLKPIKGAATVSTMVAYRVGSSDEELTSTGLSHYLEHLMFKGTDKIMPGDIDRLTQRNGGQNNAYTSEDMTVYHFDFAADRWEAALEVEADRMRNLRIDKKHEFEQEKGAVIEELHRNEDEPWDLEGKAILPLLYGKTAPYGHPVIGETEHVEKATAEIIKGHYDRWYHPNNASLIICGGFDPDKAMVKIKKLFGAIPEAKLPERKKALEIPAKRPARTEIASKFDAPRLLMGFNTVRSSDADDPVLDVIQSVLTGGKTSRLYKRFIEGDQTASSASAGNYSGRYPGWFSIQLTLLPGKDLDQGEKTLIEELKKLSDAPIKPAELERVRQSLLTEMIFSRESVHGLADSIARGVTTNDLDYLKKYFPKLLAVTADDVQRVAKKYLDADKRVVVWSVPKKQGARGPGGGFQLQAPTRLSKAQGTPSIADKAGGAAELSLKDAKRVVLPNGLVLLLYENHRLPIFVAEAYVQRTRILESETQSGVAGLTGFLLDEGTKKHTGQEIAETIENVGGTLAMSSNGGSIRVLANHRQLGMGLLFECLMQPKFGKEEFARQKTRLLAAVDEAETLPDSRGQKLFLETVYGKHPFGRPGSGRRKTIEPLTPEDCALFHARVFVPNNTILAVAGDFDSKQVIDEVTRLTADWKKAPLESPTLPALEKPGEFTQKIVTMPEAAQLHFFMGHDGIRRNNPDYYKLLVMDYVLGTGTGFTDRLSSRLRDREGLAYTVSANITTSAAEEPGVFTCYIGAQPQNFEKVKGMFLEELNRIRDEKPTQQEVDDVKQYLLGSLAFRMESNAAIASQMLSVERFNLGFDYLDQYRKSVAAVTPDDVLAVAKKYLDPKHMILVASGAIDQKGKVIEKKGPK